MLLNILSCYLKNNSIAALEGGDTDLDHGTSGETFPCATIKMNIYL